MKAKVNQLTLSLSTLQLDLTEPVFASKIAGEYSMYPNIYIARKLGEKDYPLGLRGSVLISNKSSIVASYQWQAMEGVDPDVFSATHSSGSWECLI